MTSQGGAGKQWRGGGGGEGIGKMVRIGYQSINRIKGPGRSSDKSSESSDGVCEGRDGVSAIGDNVACSGRVEHVVAFFAAVRTRRRRIQRRMKCYRHVAVKRNGRIKDSAQIVEANRPLKDNNKNHIFVEKPRQVSRVRSMSQIYKPAIRR